PTECRNELRPVLDGEAPGGAGADIDEAAGPAQSFRGGQRRLEKFKAGGPDRGQLRELALAQPLGDGQGRPSTDLRIPGARASGIHDSRGMRTRKRTLVDPNWFSRICRPRGNRK